MLKYAINFEDDEGTFLVSCPDLPEVVTWRNPQVTQSTTPKAR